VVTLADGSQAVGRTVIIATGAAYRRLDAPGVDELLGAGVFYGAAVSEAPAAAGREVFVVGAGNSAGQAAIHLAKYARRVTILARGDTLDRTMSDYLVKQIQANDTITVRLNTQMVGAAGAGQLEQLVLRNLRTGTTETVPAAVLFILIGAQPWTDWLAGTLDRDEHGFVQTGRDLLRDGQPPPGWSPDRPPLLLETSLPGVFAAGECATARSSGSPPRSGRARSPSSSRTNTSASRNRRHFPRPAHPQPLPVNPERHPTPT
jgi:thioredoxin reductase (NADPH)